MDDDRLSTASAAALEFDSALALYAYHAATDLGVDALRRLRPLDDLDALRARRRRHEEVARLLATGGGLVDSVEIPFQPALDALARGGELDGRDVVPLGQLLAISLAALARVREAGDDPDAAAPVLDADETSLR
ncbi:MAG: hypothetical protein AAF772_16855, partial [Acidobacteriota bacterium]